MYGQNGNAALATAVEPVLESVRGRIDYTIFEPERLKETIREKDEQLRDAEMRIQTLTRTNAFLRAQQAISETLIKTYQTRDKQVDGLLTSLIGALDVITNALAVASESIWSAISRGERRLTRLRKILARAYEIKR